MKSLGELFRRALDHQANGEPAGGQVHARDEESPYTLLGQKTGSPEKSATPPTRPEVLNYLGELAKDYHIPAKLVYAVADAESSVNPQVPPQNNYRHKGRSIVYDKQGNPVISSIDYGLMQINSARIGRSVLKDPHGRPFKVGEDVQTDWKANARAGVSILAGAYDLARIEQGPGATEEDHAQQAYSQYNGGSPKTRDRYLNEKNGLPVNPADRNFVLKYRKWPDKHK